VRAIVSASALTRKNGRCMKLAGNTVQLYRVLRWTRGKHIRVQRLGTAATSQWRTPVSRQVSISCSLIRCAEPCSVKV